MKPARSQALVWVLLVLVGFVVITRATPVRAANTITVSPGQSIQAAVNSASAGDTILVSAGTYNERVTISKSNITLEAQGQVVTKGFAIQNANFVTIRGFEIADAIGKGIEVLGKNCVIENNYVHFASDGGILLKVTDSDPAATSDCLVKNNRLYQNAQYGIDVRGRNHRVEGNEVWGTIQHHPNRVPSPSWADADAFHFHGSGHVFRNNYIHDIKFDGATVTSAHIDCFQTFESMPYQERATNVTIENNRCILPFYCHSDACKSNPGQAVTKGVMIQQGSNITIKNNVFYTYYGIYSDRPVPDARIHVVNNTIIGLMDQNELQCSPTGTVKCWPAGVVLDSAVNSGVMNNVFYDQLYKVMELRNQTTGMQVDYNLAYRSDGTTPPGRPPTPFGQHDLWGVSPQFVNPGGGDYHLQSNSPAINTGTNIGVTTDKDGNTRPQGSGYDIGAYEYVGTPDAPTATPAPAATATPIPTPTRTPTPSRTPTPTQTPTPSPTPTPFFCPADFNHDHTVTNEEVQLVLAQLGAQCDTCQEDLFRDGFVNAMDAGVSIASWGPCPK